MAGPRSAFRNRAFKAVHAEAAKRGMDHDALHDLCARQFSVHSMSDVTEAQLVMLYKQWTGKGLRRGNKLPRRGEAATLTAQMVSQADLVALEGEFVRRGWDELQAKAFIQRQLSGRDQVKTRSDYARVSGGIRAMNRRDSQ